MLDPRFLCIYHNLSRICGWRFVVRSFLQTILLKDTIISLEQGTLNALLIKLIIIIFIKLILK